MAKEFHPGMDVADVYAAALFGLAQEASAVDTVRAELEGVAGLLAANPQFAEFVQSTAVDDDQRRKSLERIFRGRLSDLLVNTLHVMHDHGRLALVPTVLRAFVLRLEDARGQVEVQATSAIELDDGQRRAVERLAEHLSGRKPLVEYTVDPDVLGGLVLQIGDMRYDNSLRRHLHVARTRLLARPNRGLSTESAG